MNSNSTRDTGGVTLAAMYSEAMRRMVVRELWSARRLLWLLLPALPSGALCSSLRRTLLLPPVPFPKGAMLTGWSYGTKIMPDS
jgi:hypothetical protein